MKHALASLMLMLPLSLIAVGASAQPIYRCGNVYSQIPCPQGQVVEASDSRTAAQRAEAARVVSDERRLAADIRRERLADAAAVKPAAASSLSGTAPKAEKKIVVAVRPKKKDPALRAVPAEEVVEVVSVGRKARAQR